MSAESRANAYDGPDGVGCPVCDTANPPYAQFCTRCGAHVSWSAAERRIITVLFADLTGFTGISERLDAEQVHSLITVWLDPLCEAVVRWGGHVDKFLGDCVMALFGAPIAYENEPERAVRCALDMHAAFDERAIIDHAAAAGIAGYRPRLSIGINTGAVVTGMFTSGDAWDYTAIGDTVNVAARLQSMCEPGSILLGEATWRQTGHLFEFGEERVLQVKGRSEPVRARSVTGALEVRGQVRGFAGITTPLVGRRQELERLRESWTRAAAGKPGTCLLMGGAGIGKTRLVSELVAEFDPSEVAVARGRSYPYASSTPWEPIAELIRDLHDVAAERSAPEAVEAIAAHASSPWSKDDLAGLGAVLGSPISDLQRFEGLPPPERQALMASAVARAIQEGVRLPTLLVLEDMHWADRTSLDFVRSLPEHGLEGPFLLLLVSRSPLPSEQALIELIECVERRVELAPLTVEEAAELVSGILGKHELQDDLLQMIHARSGGNPLFVEEIVKTLTGGELLIQEDEVWRMDRDIHEFAIPDSIESLISARIDGLEPRAKKVLQFAAIVGNRFWPTILSEALARRSVDVELEDLMEAALVRARPESAVVGDTEYAFEHLMLQEVAYSGLLSGMRSELHGMVASWLEGHPILEAGEYDDWVAYHFERSAEPHRALPYLERTIAGAWERGALLDAEALIDRALAVARDTDDARRLNGLAEDVARASGDDERRIAAIDRLEALAEEGGGLPVATEATYRRARRMLDLGDLEEARRLGKVAQEAWHELGDGNSEADALTLLGRISHLWADYAEALDYYRAALPLERRAGDRRGEAEILRSLGLAEVDFGNFTRALDYFDQTLGIYSEIRHRPGQAIALTNRASAFRWLGRYEQAEETAARAEELAAACASRSALAEASLVRAIAIGAAGRTDEAKALLHTFLDTVTELRRPALEAQGWLALGDLEAGDAAKDAAKRARKIAADSGLVDVEVLGLARLAALALADGDTATADQHSARAVELLEEHGDIRGPDEVVYWERYRVLAALGKDLEAAKALERARAIIQETAGWIEDDELRHSFLENVHPNPEILSGSGVA